MMADKVNIVGAGLAGSEAAWQLANRGVLVRLFEMKPQVFSPAHRSDGFAELVCSNSLGSMKDGTASGLLKLEMGTLGSLILQVARKHAVPAGGALAVEREGFSAEISTLLQNHPCIEVVREEVRSIDRSETTILASGPLTSQALASDMADMLGSDFLYFYDAIAPVIDFDSIDQQPLFWGARYDDSSDDYLNIPLDEHQYNELVNDLIGAEKVPLHDFEEPNYFESCLPIDVLAQRGPKTLAFGPLKPVGLRHPRTGKRSHAVVQLRRENSPTTMLSMVGCQNKLKYGEQKRIFQKLPGLGDAQFVRLGSVHRNTYVNSPVVLGADLAAKRSPTTYFAGLLTGVEGYLECSAIGLIVGVSVAAKLKGESMEPLPRSTMLGSLLHYLTSAREAGQSFQPINSNFALLPPINDPAIRGRRGRQARREKQTEIATAALTRWWQGHSSLFTADGGARQSLTA